MRAKYSAARAAAPSVHLPQDQSAATYPPWPPAPGGPPRSLPDEVLHRKLLQGAVQRSAFARGFRNAAHFVSVAFHRDSDSTSTGAAELNSKIPMAHHSQFPDLQRYAADR